MASRTAMWPRPQSNPWQPLQHTLTLLPGYSKLQTLLLNTQLACRNTKGAFRHNRQQCLDFCYYSSPTITWNRTTNIILKAIQVVVVITCQVYFFIFLSIFECILIFLTFNRSIYRNNFYFEKPISVAKNFLTKNLIFLFIYLVLR